MYFMLVLAAILRDKITLDFYCPNFKIRFHSKLHFSTLTFKRRTLQFWKRSSNIFTPSVRRYDVSLFGSIRYNPKLQVSCIFMSTDDR